MEEVTSDQPNIPPLPSTITGSPQNLISGFWRRLLAGIIDSLLLSMLGYICGIFLFNQLARLGVMGRLVGFLFALIYFGILNSSIGKGQTLGKRAMKINVVDRTGRHISLGRSLLRYTILSIPFFLNGAMIPSSVRISPIGYMVGFIVLGLGGATIYLFIFNRRTRQSLHDIMVDTFVTRSPSTGEIVGTVWRPHFVIVGTWLVVVAVSIILPISIYDKQTVSELNKVQREIHASGKVHFATISDGKAWRVSGGKRNETTYVHSNAIWKQKPADKESAARLVASIILDSYPEAMNKDVLGIKVIHGYDIGIARMQKSEVFAYRPEKWQELIAKHDK